MPSIMKIKTKEGKVILLDDQKDFFPGSFPVYDKSVYEGEEIIKMELAVVSPLEGVSTKSVVDIEYLGDELKDLYIEKRVINNISVQDPAFLERFKDHPNLKAPLLIIYSLKSQNLRTLESRMQGQRSVMSGR